MNIDKVTSQIKNINQDNIYLLVFKDQKGENIFRTLEEELYNKEESIISVYGSRYGNKRTLSFTLTGWDKKEILERTSIHLHFVGETQHNYYSTLSDLTESKITEKYDEFKNLTSWTKTLEYDISSQMFQSFVYEKLEAQLNIGRVQKINCSEIFFKVLEPLKFQ
jgi:hypothetical protein